MSGSLPVAAFCAAANHLLAQQPGLAATLQPHAGKTLRLELPAYALHLRIAAAGALAPDDAADAAADARIRIGSAMLLRLPLEGRSALQTADASGDAHLLDAVSQVFSRLDWDAEADLAALLGPIAGVRLAQWAGRIPDAVRHIVKTLGASAADYATEEAGWLAGRRDVERFNHGVDVLVSDAARLEARLKRLERR